MTSPIVRFMGYECIVKAETYAQGGTCLRLIEAQQGLVATATSWIPGLKVGEVAIKDYSENKGMLAALLDAGIILEPHRDVLGWPVAYLSPALDLSGKPRTELFNSDSGNPKTCFWRPCMGLDCAQYGPPCSYRDKLIADERAGTPAEVNNHG